MVTDYAQQSPQKKRSRKKLWVTVVIVLVTALAPIMMYYVRYQNVIHNKGKVTTTKKHVKKKIPSSKKTKDNKQTFDFYTLLPKMAVPLPPAKNTQ